ncbi:glycoside hydrolase family 88 protein [Melanomma pulvis-pyrius CBS 109.77]|uniref:Glycoside hydrolase family 88 protein n=1 Tax=Melanomma pulvis-pyrius CBS 109.77 TaxID=1314802 RepID=A0A6A6XHA0_9PLEO|nr:glycoside hydrolase family 88 protein [Melanomma pulvis-pyrius CBS 109.77]
MPASTESIVEPGVNGINGDHMNGVIVHESPKSISKLNETTQSFASPIVDDVLLSALYSPSAIAKIWGVSLLELDKAEPPTRYPEYTEPGGTRYISSDLLFWTSGFFPGSLHLLLERQRKWPRQFKSNSPHTLKLQYACRWWSASLHSQTSRTDTHDLGFMIQPWARIGWEIEKDISCFNSLVTAAHALASRFDPRVGCIRSWDTCFTKRYSFGDPGDDFLVIIDNMMNLDLLYYVSHLTHNPRLASIATTHALTCLSSHIRPDNSTCHVVNFEQEDGSIKERITNQGFSDTSCWSRGQAWGIAGYAQAYRWTKDARFLDASCGLADYFLSHLPDDCVPYWDFDAPLPGPRDTSAALIAAYGMLLLHEATSAEKGGRYLRPALRILNGVVAMSLAPEARFVKTSRGEEAVDMGGNETIVLNATINNYEFAPRRWADHGLVYADYYFLLIGNELLRMGLVPAA